MMNTSSGDKLSRKPFHTIGLVAALGGMLTMNACTKPSVSEAAPTAPPHTTAITGPQLVRDEKQLTAAIAAHQAVTIIHDTIQCMGGKGGVTVKDPLLAHDQTGLPIEGYATGDVANPSVILWNTADPAQPTGSGGQPCELQPNPEDPAVPDTEEEVILADNPHDPSPFGSFTAMDAKTGKPLIGNDGQPLELGFVPNY